MLPTLEDDHGRVYRCHPVAVLDFVIDEQDRILWLSRPDGENQWEVPSPKRFTG